MGTRKRILVCLEGDIEVDLVEALNEHQSFSVARRCADLVETEAAIIAGIGDAVICQDTSDLHREFLTRCEDLGVNCIVLCDSQRTDDLLDMGAVLALHDLKIEQVLKAIEGIFSLSSEAPATWSAQSPGDETLLEIKPAEVQPLYVKDLFVENNNGELAGDEVTAVVDNLSADSETKASEATSRFPSRSRLRRQEDLNSATELDEQNPSNLVHLTESESVSESLTESLLGKVLTVRGPDGAPGRSMLALNVAIELGRRGFSTILIDADLRAASLGVLSGARPEWTGLAVACRMAARGRLEPGNLSRLVHKIGDNASLLTGLSRADRWREIKAPDFTALLDCARETAQFVVIDTAAGLPEETNEYDPWEQREDIAALAVQSSDVVLTVGSADPVGIYRMIALLEDAPVASDRVIINRLSQVVSGPNAQAEVLKILEHLIEPDNVFFIPEDPVVPAAILQGRALCQVKNSGKVLRAVSDVIDSFRPVSGVTPKGAGIRRWLRFFRRG